ncbi:MAG: hypothetical protein IPN68_18490 [Bacteroidetes bacterium]|nr:hypothetical protein [Bacteroidota bacterium]
MSAKGGSRCIRYFNIGFENSSTNFLPEIELTFKPTNYLAITLSPE